MRVAKPEPVESGDAPRGPLDKFLLIFSDVRAGEAANALLMLFTIFLLLVAYYVIKVVREPLILAAPDGAALKSYASAGQALVLMGFVPLYGWLSSKVNRRVLILTVGLFFLGCVELFALAVSQDVPYVGVVFYVWVGIFSLSMIAQFWAFANDIYTKDEGTRLFPIVGIGAAAGSPIGSFLAQHLFQAKLPTPLILQVAAGLLALHLTLALWVHARASRRVATKWSEAEQKLSATNGFALVFRSRYLTLMALLFLLLNVVNTVGEYIVSAQVAEGLKPALEAAGLGELPSSSPELKAFKDRYYGSFYGSYFSVANIVSVILQAFVVSRITQFTGIRGVVLLLPLVSLTASTVIGLVGGLAVVRWAKTAENATDYSVMNTGRAMLWLPTSREEKYKAKQAVDTFFVRFGDVAAAGLVFLGKEQLQLSVRGFAGINVALALVWLALTVALLRAYQRLPGVDAPPA